MHGYISRMHTETAARMCAPSARFAGILRRHACIEARLFREETPLSRHKTGDGPGNSWHWHSRAYDGSWKWQMASGTLVEPTGMGRGGSVNRGMELTRDCLFMPMELD
jgi:hypothetical protein